MEVGRILTASASRKVPSKPVSLWKPLRLTNWSGGEVEVSQRHPVAELMGAVIDDNVLSRLASRVNTVHGADALSFRLQPPDENIMWSALEPRLVDMPEHRAVIALAVLQEAPADRGRTGLDLPVGADHGRFRVIDDDFTAGGRRGRWGQFEQVHDGLPAKVYKLVQDSPVAIHFGQKLPVQAVDEPPGFGRRCFPHSLTQGVVAIARQG